MPGSHDAFPRDNAAGAGAAPVRAVDTQMQDGPGTVGYYSGAKRYGTKATIKALVEVGRIWALRREAPRVQVGDISLEAGGDIDGHASHETGRDVDLRPLASGSYEGPLRWDSPNYSKERTQELVDLLYSNGVVQVKVIGFNGPGIQGVNWWDNHDNHLHCRFFFADEKPGFPIQQIGASNSPPTREIQRRLNVWAMSEKVLPPITVDGDFGNLTYATTQAFQEAMGLGADGVFGDATWKASLAFVY